MKHLKLLIQVLIGILVSVWLFYMAGIADVLEVIFSANVWYVNLAAVTFILASTAVALTLFISLRAMGVASSMRNTIMASFGGQLLSDLTPARSGYFLTPIILNKMDKTPIELGTASVVLIGGVNSFVKVVLATICAIYFINHFPLGPMIISSLTIGILLLLTSGIFLVSTLWLKQFKRITEKLNGLPLVGQTLGKATEAFEDFQGGGRKAARAILPIALLIALSVVINATALYVIALSLGITQLFIFEYILIAPLANVLMYIPLTVAGLGAQEAAYVLFLTILGVPLAQAVSFAVIVRVLFTGADIIGLPPLLGAGTKILYEVRSHSKNG